MAATVSTGAIRSLANQRNTPIEKTEEEAAAVIVEYALRQDSGGAGRWRGGTGVVFSVRIVREGSAVLGRGMERFVFRPWGLAGGQPGATARVIVNVGTADERDVGKLDMFVARAGDVVTIMTPGGGGFGDPLERPAAQVRADVLSGYISETAAERDYGVVLADNAVDEVATHARRASIRATRPALRRFEFGPERDAWRRGVRRRFDAGAQCAAPAAWTKRVQPPPSRDDRAGGARPGFRHQALAGGHRRYRRGSCAPCPGD